MLFRSGLEEAQAGIKIAGRNINNLRYADDSTLMAESEAELKRSLVFPILLFSSTLGWKKHKLESRSAGEISITSDMQMTPPLGQKVKRNSKAS